MNINPRKTGSISLPVGLLSSDFCSIWAAILLGGLLLAVLPGKTQPRILHTSILSEKDGLLGDYNHDIIQHSDGLLWIGSSLGLTRYDGHRFKTFTRFKSGLSDVNIAELEEYKDGRLVLKYTYQTAFIDLFDPINFSVTRLDLNRENGITGEPVHIYVQPRGDIFVISQSRQAIHLQRYDGTGKFVKIAGVPPPDAGIGMPLVAFTQDIQGRFWWSVEGSGLYLLTPNGAIRRTYLPMDFQFVEKVLPPARILYTDQQGRLWLAFQNKSGIYEFQAATGDFQPHGSLPREAFYDFVWEDQEGNLLFKIGSQQWHSTAEHLYCLASEGHWEDFSPLGDYNPYVLSAFAHNFFKTVYLGAGSVIRKVDLHHLNLQQILTQPLEEGQWGISIKGISGDGHGSVFFIREVRNWYRLDLSSGSLDTIPLRRTEDGTPINWRQGRGIHVDPRYVWSAGSIDRGRGCLLRYDRLQGTFRAFNADMLIRDFTADGENGFWLAWSDEQRSELVYFDRETNEFSPYRDADGHNPLDGHFPLRLTLCQDGELWIGTITGLVRIDPGRRVSRVYGQRQIEDKEGRLTEHRIEAVYPDENGLLWLGTGNGIVIFDPERDRVVKEYKRSDGLAGNRISNFMADSSGNIWITTYSGLSYFDRSRKHFYNYYQSDGLPFESINRRTLWQDERGAVYIGGLNGAVAFAPDPLLQKRVHPAPVLTGWSVYDEGTQTLTEHFSGLQTLNISSSTSFFECHFTLPHFDKPELHLFSAWLEGFDKEWNFLGTTPSIRFNRLPAGKYRLHVRASDHHGNESGKELLLAIDVAEVYYRTWWFLGLGLVTVFVVGVWFYKSELERRVALQEARQLHELDEFKSKLYASITHEFRTPLTVILGLSRQMLDTSASEEQRSSLNHIRYSGYRLLRLVNQILDLRKLESGRLQVNLIQGDIVPVLRYLNESFHSLAVSRHIQMQFKVNQDPIIMDYDPDKLTIIISNLLSNAIKYTPEGGAVYFEASASPEGLTFRIRDTGIGIPADQLPHIFDRFFQVSRSSSKAQGTNSTGFGDGRKWAGTGIGLTLTKELVELMGGRIEVRSREKEGTTFEIYLPVTNTAPMDFETPETIDYQTLEKSVSAVFEQPVDSREEDRPVVLVVEDDPHISHYIYRCLHEDYQLFFAPDGHQGEEKAFEIIPDLIISDVMMPHQDGFGLCRKVKNDERTSHIPFILLTARADIEDRLEGLKRGADIYLAKPFQEEELHLHMRNLLRMQERLQAYFRGRDPDEELLEEGIRPSRNSDLESSATLFDLQAENAFMEKVKGIIRNNISNPDFTMAELCRQMAMSSSQLHRKITALTSEPASKLLRHMRLDHARELLRHTQMNIGEVAFESGFNDPSYFTRIFNKDTGMTPTEYREHFFKKEF